MERLEPVLKQKFWILLGIGMIMTIVGWWVATSSLAAQIVARTTEIKGAFDKVPGGQIPNESWSTQLAARNSEQDQAKQITARGLWERQKERMTWPGSVAEFAWANGYRGEIALTGRENYRTAYSLDVRRVWEVVRPFDPLTGTGIVEFGSQQAEALPQQTWGALAPSSAEMWDAQEDLWLLESILQSITDVNGGITGERLDASIHVIEKLELHGGLPASQRKSQAAGPAGGKTAGPGGPMSAAHGSSAPAMSSSFGGGGGGEGLFGGGMGGRGGGDALASADFDWKEELGDDGSGGGRGGIGGAGGMPTAMSAGSSSAPMSAAHGSAGGAKPGAGGAGAAAAVSKVRRYIDDDASIPYKTRGFYMTVIMDHRKIPGLISELTSSEKSAWPVEIVRVQMARIHDDDVEAGSGPGGGSSGGARPVARGGASRQPSYSAGEGSMPSSFGGGGLGGGIGRDRGGPAVNAPQAEAANVALESALQDPFMAKVAICGIITLYKEVKADPKAAVAPAPVPAAPKVEAVPSTETPASEQPAAAQTAPGDAAEKPAADEAKPGVPEGTPDSPAAETKGPEAKIPADPKASPNESK